MPERNLFSAVSDNQLLCRATADKGNISVPLKTTDDHTECASLQMVRTKPLSARNLVLCSVFLRRINAMASATLITMTGLWNTDAIHSHSFLGECAGCKTGVGFKGYMRLLG